MTIALERKFGTYSARAVTFAGLYRRVVDAAVAAHRLEERYPIFHQALYHEELAMLYFLVEDALGQYDHVDMLRKSSKEKAEMIHRLVGG